MQSALVSCSCEIIKLEPFVAGVDCHSGCTGSREADPYVSLSNNVSQTRRGSRATGAGVDYFFFRLLLTAADDDRRRPLGFESPPAVTYPDRVPFWHRLCRFGLGCQSFLTLASTIDTRPANTALVRHTMPAVSIETTILMLDIIAPY